MIDERTRIRESWAMSMDTLISDAREEEQLNMARALLRDGMDFDLVQRYTNLDISVLQSLASELKMS